ncbi:siderophore ABC transporter substrate-binding protein [Neisseria elongata]|uniref:Siderophore ABC transporter substrate-binding protein n=1 Tax=Neisseria elongata subsp. nitroreducens TaxID=90367 RepID=A0A9X0ZWN5_NEIEL|nr:siderophore ABC transporter substrate-binding protein [Neisseria elongata]MBS9340820.1 siderophore ABC transporter substrate-binding protein [Neisseria elongata subsp. nitroreducens]
MKFRSVFMALSCAFALAACGGQDGSASVQAGSAAAEVPAGSVKVQTAHGEAVVPQNPERVAVYDLGAVDTLSKLGVKIGASVDAQNLAYLDAPLKDAVKAGTLFEPNYEALNAYNPQLIVIGSRMAKDKVSDELAKLAPTIDMTAQTDNMKESAKARIDAYGRIFGKQAEADALKAEIDKTFADAKAAAQGKGKGLVILVNAGKLSAFGPDSRLGGWIHRDIGVPAADEAIKEGSHGQPVSFEYIKEKNPDWLFVLDRSAAIGEEGQAAREVLNNPLVAQSTAWKKGQVVYLPPETYLAAGGAQELLNAGNLLKDAFSQAK